MTTYQGFKGGYPANQPFHPTANRRPACGVLPARDADNVFATITRRLTLYDILAIAGGNLAAGLPGVLATSDIVQAFLIPQDSVLESVGVQIDAMPSGLTFDMTLASAQSLSGQKYSYDMTVQNASVDTEGCPVICPGAPTASSAAVPTGLGGSLVRVIVRDFVTHPYSGLGDAVQLAITGVPSGQWKLSQCHAKFQFTYRTLFEW